MNNYKVIIIYTKNIYSLKHPEHSDFHYLILS